MTIELLAFISASIPFITYAIFRLWQRDTVLAIANERKAKEEGRI